MTTVVNKTAQVHTHSLWHVGCFSPSTRPVELDILQIVIELELNL